MNPSSRQINSLENVNPGIKPRFFNQKIAANEPLKNIPSTAANATNLSAYKASSLWIHLIAQSAFSYKWDIVNSIKQKVCFFGVFEICFY